MSQVFRTNYTFAVIGIQKYFNVEPPNISNSNNCQDNSVKVLNWLKDNGVDYDARIAYSIDNIKAFQWIIFNHQSDNIISHLNSYLDVNESLYEWL